MKESAAKYLLISIAAVWLAGCGSPAPALKSPAPAAAPDAVVWTPEYRSGNEKNTYRVTLQTPGNVITGICLLKKSGDTWRGTLVNEFGAKAFDFILTDERCELLHVISGMDKWYIKKTVAADLYYLFNVDNPKASFHKRLERFRQDGGLAVSYGKKHILVKPDGSIRLVNKRRHLQYELWKINEIDPAKELL
jgi:hypothetical protein